MPRRRIESSSEDDDDDGGNNYVTSSRSRGSQLGPQEKAKLAGLLCNFLLVSENTKIPAKMADIKKLVLKDRARHFKYVMDEANNIMKKVFGYKIEAVQSNSYILVNTLDVNAGEGSGATEAQAVRLGLLTSILAAIFMNGDKMHEAVMEDYLKALGVDMHSKASHPLLGNVHKLIHQELVREKYLDVTLDTDADPPCREYKWGERARLELSKMDILELVCKVYGDNMQPEVWTSQWREAEKEAATQRSQNT